MDDEYEGISEGDSGASGGGQNVHGRDPYGRLLQSAKDAIRPDLTGSSSKGSDETGSIRDKAKSFLGGKEDGAVGKKDSKSKAVGGGLGKGGKDSAMGGLYAGGAAGGKVGMAMKAAKAMKNGKLKGKAVKYSAVGVILIGVAIGAVASVILGAPVFMVATMDYNLQDSLGFSETVAVLEEQSEHVTTAMLRKGKVPGEFAQDLANNGIDVGQVTAKGDFVKTNEYIAGLNEGEVAANGEYRVVDGENGELAVMYGGKVITADNFVATVESDPKMYASFAEATDISARFYYSSDVDKVYKDMGVSRGNFFDWEATTDPTADQESFNEALAKALESDSDLSVGGCDKEECKMDATIKTGDNASDKVSEVANKIKGDSGEAATQKAAGLLNAAVSSNEPYKAAKAFIGVEEPLQRARIGDNGPVNELMNVLSTESELTYTDVNTGKEVTKTMSILSTPNFAAAVSKGNYSVEEANNFSRDRVLVATSQANGSVITDTTVNTESSSKSGSILKVGNASSASDETLQKASNSIAIAATENSADLFKSEAGGNRVVEGGSFINNTINRRVLGAMPSDEATITAYHHETKQLLARKAEAERATRSPFDISSPYTFMGNIAYSLMGTYVQNLANHNDSMTVVPLVGTVANAVGSAAGKLVGGAMADGESDDLFTDLTGQCYTAPTANNVEGDLYCNDFNTISTKYMEYDEDDWINALPNDLDESGKIKESSVMGEEFVPLAMDREATVGVKSYEVCEAYRKTHGNLLSNIFDDISKWFGMYESCNGDASTNGKDENGNEKTVDGVPGSVSTGAKYTFSDSNSYKGDMEAYAAYMRFDTVNSLLSSKKSSVSLFREEYYAKYPKDDSEAGIIARRSGMSKAEAQLALDYAAELSIIANYNPADRYVFGAPVFEMPQKDILIEHSDTVQVSLYCMWCSKTEYADVRNKNFAA